MGFLLIRACNFHLLTRCSSLAVLSMVDMDTEIKLQRHEKLGKGHQPRVHRR